MVNIKGLYTSLLVKALDRRFVYDLQKKEEEVNDSSDRLFCISRQSLPQKKGELLFQFQVFTVVIRTVQLPHFYLSHRASFKVQYERNKAIAVCKKLSCSERKT